MSFHQEHEPVEYQVFSPFGPFRQTHPERGGQQITHELHQLQTYPTYNHEGVSSNNAGHRHASTSTPTLRTVETADGLCNCKQVCYHAQQLICSTAVLTGLALVIVGAIQGNEHDNLLYIGILLILVGFGLIILTWNVHRKIKKRQKRNMSVPQQHFVAEDGNTQATVQPLLPDPNRILMQPSCNSHTIVNDTSPSELRSVTSLHCYSSHIRHHERFHNHRPNQQIASHSAHHLPRYDVYSSQAASGYHDLAHSVPLQDKV